MFVFFVVVVVVVVVICIFPVILVLQIDLADCKICLLQVDVFMDAAFGAVCVSMKFLKIKLSAQQDDFCTKSSLTSEQIVHFLCQQCEASLQFLQLLCQQKLFRERLLRNKVSKQDLSVLKVWRKMFRWNNLDSVVCKFVV